MFGKSVSCGSGKAIAILRERVLRIGLVFFWPVISKPFKSETMFKSSVSPRILYIPNLEFYPSSGIIGLTLNDVNSLPLAT